jgi:hypothetical protein
MSAILKMMMKPVAVEVSDGKMIVHPSMRKTGN